MVERRIRASVKATADLWFTARVDAGQPDLNKWMDRQPTAEELKIAPTKWHCGKKANFSREEGTIIKAIISVIVCPD